MTQLTFTEEEVKKTADFVQFVYDHGKFELSTKQSLALTRFFGHMNELIKKMDSHIMELKRVVKKPEEEQKIAKRKGK